MHVKTLNTAEDTQGDYQQVFTAEAAHLKSTSGVLFHTHSFYCVAYRSFCLLNKDMMKYVFIYPRFLLNFKS